MRGPNALWYLGTGRGRGEFLSAKRNDRTHIIEDPEP
jgi:hypothetical protein